MTTDVRLGEIDNFLRLAQQEIYETYGDVVRFGRKSLQKYGRNQNVSTTQVDITTNSGTEVHTFANTITHVSSSNAADVGVTVYIEYMTISGGVFSFNTQSVTLNGQNKVALPTPCAEVTRIRGVTQGNVYAYEDTTLTAGKPTDTTKIHNTLVGVDRTSLKAATAIAGNNYFVLCRCWAALGKSAGSAAADIRLKIATINDAQLGNSFYSDFVRAVSLSSPLERDFRPLEVVRPNSLIAMTAVASSGTLDVQAGFSGFFGDVVTDGRLVKQIVKGFI